MVTDEFEVVLQEQTAALSEEMSQRHRADREARAYRRVAEEAIRLLSPGQLAQRRARLDALEAGGRNEDDRGGRGG